LDKDAPGASVAMTTLVTGATGFIGTNIVESMLAAGEPVIAYSVATPSARQSELAKRGELTFVTGDVRDQSALEQVLGTHRVRRVIHAAVVTSNAERERSQGPFIVDVNLVGAAATATAAARAGVERFVLVSSAGVYSTHAMPDGEVASEDTPHRVDTLYGVGKSAAETIVRRIFALNGLPFVIGRVATAFGPWEHDTGYRDTLSPLLQLTQRARAGEPVRLARDKQSNWHYGRDAGAALATLALSVNVPRFEDYNLGPDLVWPLSAWCDLLSERYPHFRYEIGGVGNVELYGDKDGGVLSGARFTDEFGSVARYAVDEAFDDYLSWLMTGDTAGV
jgi:UDP-glucuronate 4-epimerase